MLAIFAEKMAEHWEPEATRPKFIKDDCHFVKIALFLAAISQTIIILCFPPFPFLPSYPFHSRLKPYASAYRTCLLVAATLVYIWERLMFLEF